MRQELLYFQYLLQMSCCPAEKVQVTEKKQNLPKKSYVPQNTTQINGQWGVEKEQQLVYLSSAKSLFIQKFTEEVSENLLNLKRMMTQQIKIEDIDQFQKRYKHNVSFKSVEKYFGKSKYDVSENKKEDTEISQRLMEPYMYVCSLTVSNKQLIQDFKNLLTRNLQKLKRGSLQECKGEQEIYDRLQQMDKKLVECLKQTVKVIEEVMYENKVNRQKYKEDQVLLYEDVIIPKIRLELDRMQNLYFQLIKNQVKGQLRNTETNIVNLFYKNPETFRDMKQGQVNNNLQLSSMAEASGISIEANQHQQLKSKCQEQSKQIYQLKAECQKLKEQKEKLMHYQVPSLQKANIALTLQLNLMKEQLLELNSVIAGNQRINRQLSDRSSNIEKQNEQLLKQMREANSLVSTYEVDVPKLKQTIARLQSQLQQFKKESVLHIPRQAENGFSQQKKEESFEYLARLQDLEQSSIKYSSETSKLKQELQSVSTECFSYRVETKNKEGQIQRLKNLLNSTQDQSSRVRQDIEILKSQNINTKSKCEQLSQQKDKLFEKMKETEQKMNLANGQFIKQRQIIEIKLKEAVKEIEQYQSQIAWMNKELQLGKVQIQNVKHLSQNMKSLNLQLTAQIEKLKQKNKILEGQKQKQDVLNTEERHKQQMSKRDNQLKQIALKNNELERQKQQLEVNWLNEKQKNEELNKQNQLLIDQINKLKRQMELLKQQLQEGKTLNMQLSTKLQGLRDNTRLRSKSFVEHVTLFGGKILEKRKTEKRFLIESIERHMSRIIEKTEYLYNFKRDGKINFHERIDNLSNIVVVVQTKNAVFAGYYSGKYVEKGGMTEQGLLISLTNYKSYLLNNQKNFPRKEKPKPVFGMIYDKYYLIFGNSEIRIKGGEKEKNVFSNFGVSNSYFNSKEDKIEVLMRAGEKVNEVQFVNYELYEVIFDSELQFVQ